MVLVLYLVRWDLVLVMNYLSSRSSSFRKIFSRLHSQNNVRQICVDLNFKYGQVNKWISSNAARYISNTRIHQFCMLTSCRIFTCCIFRLSDINECTFMPDACPNGRCLNTMGSYRCACDDGFKVAESGKQCVGKRCQL